MRLWALNFRTFKHLWKQVGQNLDIYKTYPRLVGECGGKNYHCVHPTADVLSVVNGTVRSAFEYSGQKCSAVSRMYVPESLWPQIKEGLIETSKEVKVGPCDEFTTYTSCVIDSAAFNRIAGYLELAKSSPDITVLAGGGADNSVGYFIEPTILQTSNPKNKLMEEEIFGPVLTVYVYADDKWDETLELINETSPYGLTGALYARDRDVIDKASRVLRNSAGNFYINDKSTGSVVGQQPFGGARISGTNDKAGGESYVLKWVSPQSIKETFVPTTSISYPSVDKS